MNNTGLLPIDESGILTPGIYELFAESTATNGTASYDIGFAVPEPGSFALVASGLFAVALRRSRRGRSLRT